jgi:large subunit ribosomal protein L13Ae
MLPHKTKRGQLALGRLAVNRSISILLPRVSSRIFYKAYEGIPEPYDKKKRVVVPDALKVLRLRADRQFTVLGELSKEVGWGYTDLVARLEAQRKVKEQAFYAEKKAEIALKAKAAAAADLSAVANVLSSFGF